MSTKRFCLQAFLIASVVLTVAGLAFAGPSLDISKKNPGYVQPIPSWTGPQQDPDAILGQWFLNRDGTEEYRTHEFYDNVLGYGGGFASAGAITGYATNIQYDTTGVNIVGFDIIATITNDTPGEGDWRGGTNSHGEWLATNEQYRGTLWDTKLAVEFAVDMPSFNVWRANVSSVADPYTITDPLIVAEEIDELGWYCWTPDNPEQLAPAGGYLVPTYDFGNIPIGKSVTRILSFTVPGGGLTSSDLRYQALRSGQDLFQNRTTSLKISNWIEMLGIDNGMSYPTDEMNYPLLNSDVSVFHSVPEPSTLVLLSMALVGGLFLVIRRKK